MRKHRTRPRLYFSRFGAIAKDAVAPPAGDELNKIFLQKRFTYRPTVTRRGFR